MLSVKYSQTAKEVGNVQKEYVQEIQTVQIIKLET